MDAAANRCNHTLALQLTSLHGVMNSAPAVHPRRICALTRVHTRTHGGQHGRGFDGDTLNQSMVQGSDFSRVFDFPELTHSICNV